MQRPENTRVLARSWESNLGPLEKQHTILTTQHLFSPTMYIFISRVQWFLVLFIHNSDLSGANLLKFNLLFSQTWENFAYFEFFR